MSKALLNYAASAVDGHEDHAAPHARPSSPNTLCRKLDPSRPPPCPRRPLPPSTKTRAKRRQARAAINARAETARTYAFAVLVFAEMLRSFGARSEIKPVWRISLLTNVNLVIVVAMSLGLQVWSQHNATLGSFLKTSFMPLADGFLLLAVGAIPLLILEMVKVGAARRRQRKCDHEVK